MDTVTKRTDGEIADSILRRLAADPENTVNVDINPDQFFGQIDGFVDLEPDELDYLQRIGAETQEDDPVLNAKIDELNEVPGINERIANWVDGEAAKRRSAGNN